MPLAEFARSVFTPTASERLREVTVELDDAIEFSGTITPDTTILARETSYTILGLAVAAPRAKHRLPKNWLIFELFARNGKLKLEADGHGGKRKTVATIDLDVSVAAGTAIPYDLEWDGEVLSGHVGGKQFSVGPALKSKDTNLVLYMGAPAGIDNQSPIGWEINYNIA